MYQELLKRCRNWKCSPVSLFCVYNNQSDSQRELPQLSEMQNPIPPLCSEHMKSGSDHWHILAHNGIAFLCKHPPSSQNHHQHAPPIVIIIVVMRRSVGSVIWLWHYQESITAALRLSNNQLLLSSPRAPDTKSTKRQIQSKLPFNNDDNIVNVVNPVVCIVSGDTQTRPLANLLCCFYIILPTPRFSAI